MDKEEILAKSRGENKNADLPGEEITQWGLTVGAMVAVVVATVFFFLQLALRHGKNYGLYTILISIIATKNIVQAIKLKKKKDIMTAAFYTIAGIATAAAHIVYLVKL